MLHEDLNKIAENSNGSYNFSYKLKLPGRTDTLYIDGQCIFDKYSNAAYPKFNLLLNTTLQYIFDGESLIVLDLKSKSGTIFNTKDATIGMDPITGNMFSQIIGNIVMDNTATNDIINNYNTESISEKPNMNSYSLQHVNGSSTIKLQIDRKLKNIQVSRIIDSAIDAQFEEWHISNIKQGDYKDPKYYRLNKTYQDFLLTQYHRKRQEQSLQLNQFAPILSQRSIDGKMISIDQFPGKLLLIDFWYSSCYPCIESFPVIKKLAKDFEKELIVIGINPIDKLSGSFQDFLVKNKINYNTILDSTDIAKRYFIHSFPTTILLDQHLKIQFIKVGYSENLENDLARKISSLLSKTKN